MIATKTIRESIENAYPFTVDKLPLFGPDHIKTPFYGCFRSDTGKICGNPVKQSYVPHDIEDIIALAEAGMEGFEGVDIEAKWHGNGQRLIISPSKEYRRNIFGTKDATFPRAIIAAEYGGTGAFHGTLAIYRDVCNNLMLLEPAGQKVSMKIKHSSQLRDKISVLIMQFHGLLDKWNGVADHAVEMNNKEIFLKDYMAELFPAPETKSETVRNNYLKKIETIIGRIQRERNAFGVFGKSLNKATQWEAFTAVQGYVQHDSRRHGNPDWHNRAFSAMENPLVSRAYELAVAM